MSSVLVAYERPSARATVARILTDAGYDVFAVTPDDALAVARRHAVQVVVTDDVALLDCGFQDGRPKLRVLYARNPADEQATAARDGFSR